MTLTPGLVEARLRSLFPAGVAVAAQPIVPATTDALWPEERLAIAGAVPGRLAEFVAGRSAARRVLHALGLPAQALPMAPDRAPVWPPGIFGSIAHAAGFAVAVARLGGPLGVDIEADDEIAPDLWDIICGPDELIRLGSQRIGHLVRRVFCAKEAVFKAQAPEARALFGHETLSVTLAETSFDAQFLASVGAFTAGRIVRGRLDSSGGLVLAGVVV
jgi:4'-phosphopantetheinyl transferase EntD